MNDTTKPDPGPDPDAAADLSAVDAALEDAKRTGMADLDPAPSSSSSSSAGDDSPAPGPERIPTIEMVRPMVDLVGNAMAATGRFKRAFIESETDALAKVYAQLLDKYFPAMNWGVEATAALLTVGIVFPLIQPGGAPDADAGGESSSDQDKVLELLGDDQDAPG